MQSNKININGKDYGFVFNIGVIRQFGRAKNLKSLSSTAEYIGKVFEGIDDFDNMDAAADFLLMAIRASEGRVELTLDDVITSMYDAETMNVIADALSESFKGEETEKKPTRAQRRKAAK